MEERSEEQLYGGNTRGKRDLTKGRIGRKGKVRGEDIERKGDDEGRIIRSEGKHRREKLDRGRVENKEEVRGEDM